MKNKLGKILSILTILALVMIPTVQAANKIQIGEKISYYGILGDVNRDGKINSQDSKLVLEYSAGTRRLTIFQKKRADVNQDGKINSQDSILILKYGSSSNTNTNQSNKVNVSSIKISGATEMYKGETKKLTATIEPNNATDKQIKWSSSSDVRATVDQNGNVTAKNSGIVRITAKVGEISATHRIEIKERKVQATRIDIIKNPTKMSYNLNDKLDTTGMKIKVTYSDGTTEEKTKGFSATPTQLTKTGKQEITVKYSGLTAKLKVSVGAISRLGTATISAINSTAITGGMATNKGNTAWVVKNCVSNANVTGIKINANKNYVSSGAICLYFANQILKQGNNSEKVIIKTYNYSIPSKAEVGLDELIKLKETNEAEVQKLIKDEIKIAYNNAKSLQELGYNIYQRDVNSNMYKVSETDTYLLTQDGYVYLIYSYGNNSYTNEVDVVIF